MVEARVKQMLGGEALSVVDFVIESSDVLGGLFSDEDLAVPAMQVFLLVLMNSICLLLGRLGLLVSYCFAFHWGFVFDKDYFVSAQAVTPRAWPSLPSPAWRCSSWR